MIVLYWMTPDPVVATEDMSLLEVVHLMRRHRIRRLPVVRAEVEAELCGIVGRTDLFRWVRPEDLRGDLSPAVAEKLGSRRVADAMTSNPVTCDAHEHIEDVCRRMCQAKVGAFPVLLRGHLVGILSETDLLRALAELTYQGGEAARVSIRVPIRRKEDILYSIVDLARRASLELYAVLTHPILDDSAYMATLRVRGNRIDTFVKSLWDAGYKVENVS